MEWGSSGKTHYEGQDLLADLMLQVVVFFFIFNFYGSNSEAHKMFSTRHKFPLISIFIKTFPYSQTSISIYN